MTTRCLHPDDPHYPADMALIELLGDSWARPPPPLYLRGWLPRGRAVAIVGSRRASAQATAFARSLASAFAAAGWCVWSGGARGIDRAAHEGALEAGGTTVVVTAGGLDDPYPADHAPLYQQIVDGGGGLLSLQADGHRRRRHHFLWRNTVMAALSLATVLVEAAARSGALSTVSAARRLARPVLVVPRAPWDPSAPGCHATLLRGGVTIVSPEHGLRELERVARAGWRAAPERVAPAAPEGAPGQLRLPGAAGAPDQGEIDEGARAVLLHLSAEPRHLDWLCAQTGLGARQVSQALLTLRLAGCASEGPPGLHWLTADNPCLAAMDAGTAGR